MRTYFWVTILSYISAMVETAYRTVHCDFIWIICIYIFCKADIVTFTLVDLEARVADPDPNPTLKKKPDLDLTFNKCQIRIRPNINCY